MKTAPGFVRVHLLTLFVAMLFVSGMLGLNLQRREQVFYSFHAGTSFSVAGDGNILVKFHERSYYGWPYTLSASETISCYIVQAPTSEEARQVPMNSMVITDTINPGHLSEVAPKLYRSIQKASVVSRTTDELWYSSALYQYLVALVLLFAVMVFIELHIRSASSLKQNPELLPEG